MDQNNGDQLNALKDTVRELELKLAKLQREKSVFSMKSKLLSEEMQNYRSRERRYENTVEQLIERQHELNVMLNRSNLMLAKAQDATAMLSLEFNELARALPAQAEHVEDAQAIEVDNKVKKINDLFKKTGSLTEEISETLKQSSEVKSHEVTVDRTQFVHETVARPQNAAPNQTNPDPEPVPAAEPLHVEQPATSEPVTNKDFQDEIPEPAEVTGSEDFDTQEAALQIEDEAEQLPEDETIIEEAIHSIEEDIHVSENASAFDQKFAATHIEQINEVIISAPEQDNSPDEARNPARGGLTITEIGSNNPKLDEILAEFEDEPVRQSPKRSWWSRLVSKD